ncbi:MAG: hypothetical protein CMO01_21130 [Thalassobius sp.]|nr:hypothetical protein [Thalassovita sp.]
MSDIAIKVDGLSKLYKIGTQKSGSFRESFSSLFTSNNNKEQNDDAQKDFWALNDVSFEIKKGEAVGIIGRNGAGKSTLLKVLSRITEPTKGRIEINGRVASLLEVGTGFHPELTGRENIFLNGTILGMSRREVKAKFDEIVDFSGVEKFIDTPVKHYSSGMYVRLAFAVAAHLEPEILIIDEVLAVGDAEFQKKCLGKMEDVSKNQGRTVLFVSHNMGAVQNLCKQVIVLSKGKLNYSGKTINGINQYLKSKNSNSLDLLKFRLKEADKLKFRFTNYEIESEEGFKIDSVLTGMSFIIRTHYEAITEIEELIIRIQIVDSKGNIVSTLNNFHSLYPFKNLKRKSSVACKILKNPLMEGIYTLNFQALINRSVVDDIDNVGKLMVYEGDFFNTGKIPHIKEGVLIEHTWLI